MVKTLSGANVHEQSAGLIDAIPAEAAWIDCRGVIIAVNNRWLKRTRSDGGERGNSNDLGRNYLETWRQRADSIGDGANHIALGLERLLNEELDEFSHLFREGSGSDAQWRRIIASPANDGGGAVVMVFLVDPANVRADLASIVGHGTGALADTSQKPASRAKVDSEDEGLIQVLLPVYQSLLRDSLFRPEQVGADVSDRRAEAIGKQLATAGVDAGFVLRMHIDALRSLQRQVGSADSKWLSVESRIVFISVLGFLTNSYRDALRNRGNDQNDDFAAKTI